MSDEIRAVSLDIPGASDTVWHPALLSKLFAYDIQGQLHPWLTDFLYSRSQRVTLNRMLSSLFTVKAGVPKSSVLSLVLFLSSSIISLTLENPLYLFADDSTLSRDIPHPSGSWAAASSLSSDLDRITSWSNT